MTTDRTYLSTSVAESRASSPRSCLTLAWRSSTWACTREEGRGSKRIGAWRAVALVPSTTPSLFDMRGGLKICSFRQKPLPRGGEGGTSPTPARSCGSMPREAFASFPLNFFYNFLPEMERSHVPCAKPAPKVRYTFFVESQQRKRVKTNLSQKGPRRDERTCI